MKSVAKKAVNNLLKPLGVELRHISSASDVPPVFSCPLEALFYTQGGKSCLFFCPVEKVTHVAGLGLGSKAWNPFVETLTEYQKNPQLLYEGSTLRLFFDRSNPKNASEGLLGFADAPERFSNLAPHLIFLSPWSSLAEGEVSQDVLWWNKKDNTEHGRSDLSYPDDGWPFFGPVSRAKGELEFFRALAVYNS